LNEPKFDSWNYIFVDFSYSTFHTTQNIQIGTWMDIGPNAWRLVFDGMGQKQTGGSALSGSGLQVAKTTVT